MKKTTKLLVWLVEAIVRLGYMVIAIVIIVAIAYWLGYDFLFSLKGGDTAHNLSIIYWFNHWYPQIPKWYPLQGGGVSLVHGYHFLAHLMTVWLHRLTSLSLENAYQALGFASVPLTALGIYFFVWTRLKNQTAALLAGVFYFLSPITWVWLFDWGFYGEAVSYFFIPPALIFFDIFFTAWLERRVNFWARLSLIVGVVFLMLLWMTHAIAFLGIVFFFPVYGLLYPLISTKTQRFKNAFRGLVAVFIFLAATYLLAAFHELHFQYYSLQSQTAGQASREFFLTDAAEWYFRPFLSLGEIPVENRRYAERNVALAVPVWALALLGLIAAWPLSKKLFVIGLYSLFSFIFIYNPIPVWRILNLTGAQHYRPLIICLRVFLPILAAFGVAALPQLAGSICFFWRRFLNKSLARLVLILQSLLVAVATLTLGIVVIVGCRYYATLPSYIRYGPQLINFELVDDQQWPYLCPDQQNPFKPRFCQMPTKTKIDLKQLSYLCEPWQADLTLPSKPEFCEKKPSGASLDELFNQCYNNTASAETTHFCPAVLQPWQLKLSLANWPQPKLTADRSIFKSGLEEEFLSLKTENEPVRLDVSPNLGGVTQTFNMENYSDSMLNLWGYQASLNHSYWGYQQNSFYGKGNSPAQVANVAQWFGAQYVLLNEGADPPENFTQDPEHWQELSPSIYRFKTRLKPYSYTTNKPVILVIASHEQAAYETFFRLANLGVLPYESAFLVLGQERVDAYSLAELEQFDALVLFGYSYKRQAKAFGLLDNYLKQGGKVFLSTGWQYIDADWQLENAPDFMPVTALSWSKNIDSSAEFKLEDDSLNQIKTSQFDPLVWGDQPWGVSLAAQVRPWAKTLLSINSQPIVVSGDYGQGKIVWTGLNWPGHISTYNDNPEEIKFLQTVFQALLTSEVNDELVQTEQVTVKRDFPDKVEVVFSQTAEPGNFYWRESYHPDWRAYWLSNDKKTRLPIYRAGPLYQLVFTPAAKVGDRLIFEYHPRLRGVLANLISALTLIGLLIYLIKGSLAFGWSKKALGKIHQPISKKIKTWRQTWEEDE
ncbi:hypothetical protein KKD62_01475 [Patescibacteria group bacterium]|nr:hypothetical protein [Patescibacteria group bacterium]MBU1931393.1 hypothetical protein [Patescibacteria group bacterium]